MQVTHIKNKVTNEGKMLYGFVKNYINERGTFNTEVCQYSFGMGVADPALSELDTQIEAKETISN